MKIDELIAREEIRRTLAAYHLAGDRARTDEFASLFTSDGVLETPQSRHEGRENIRQWMRGMTQRPAPAGGTPKMTFVRHHITTCHIELTGPDTASVRTYYAVFTDSGPDHCGYYVDTFRREGERWLIAQRKARLDWRSPQSVFGP